ncbi:hypothetical protein LPN04_17415 [Rugamonas sp. A1-17]|nr:hypothetical protein [Rugamonas sp. A1-17]
MTEFDSNKQLVDKLRVHLPAEAILTDQWLRERGWNPNEDQVALNWVEAFADRTTEAILRRDSEAVQAHTDFLANAYRADPEKLRVIIDVSYAENIMWDASMEDKVWAWKFIATEIRQFYTDMWGSPTQES